MDTPYSSLTLDEVASTQEVARERVEPDLPAVVVAHRQTRGRGRGGAQWQTAPRAVAVSVGCRPRWEAASWPLIPLVGGVAARRVIGPGVGLKWPNDVMRGDEKVGGILVEAEGEVVVVGMGLNLFWPRPPSGAGGLLDGDPGGEEGPRLAYLWAEELLALLEREPAAWPRDEYRAACATIGREITWEARGRGRAVGIGRDGSLEVLTSDGRQQYLSSGAVHHIRPV